MSFAISACMTTAQGITLYFRTTNRLGKMQDALGFIRSIEYAQVVQQSVTVVV
jgi:hypothetical protein